eukprot:104080-Prymnesium_polylepis.1
MVRVVAPGESALTAPGGPHPAAPGGEDASLGHAVKLVARACMSSFAYKDRVFCPFTDANGHARLTGRLE